MRTLLLPATIIALCLPAAASAQAISDDMTCEEAVAYYEKNRRIETRDEGQVLPIDGGVPVSQRNDIACDPGELPSPILLKTRDKEECAVAYSCPEE